VGAVHEKGGFSGIGFQPVETALADVAQTQTVWFDIPELRTQGVTQVLSDSPERTIILR